MLSDGEENFGSGAFTRHFAFYKRYLMDLFRCIFLMVGCDAPVRFRLEIGDTAFCFFVTDLYHDASAHKLVASDYICQAKPGTDAANLIKSVDFHPHPHLSKELNELWGTMIPSMVERCRDWEHKEACKYYNASTTEPFSFFCS